MATSELTQLLEVAIDAAYRAGRRTLAYFNAGVAVEIKSDNTPVTAADRESEQIIRDTIARYFPTHAILGEEQGATAGDEDYRWIIDPLDGTKSFVHGVPLYGVLIGVEVRKEPVVGVIYLPALDEMVYAASGMGCRWNGRPARVSNVSNLGDALLTTTSPIRCLERSDAYANLVKQTRLQRAWGDCYGYVLVATGRAEIMLDPVMNAWDAAPMVPILREAGGRFFNWRGEQTIWCSDGAAANVALADQVAQVLRSERRTQEGR